jgi:hypothetical protein
MIQLRPYRSGSIFSCSDRTTETENESKWSIVRQRLPDILALSNTYKPTNVRTQLALLIALMNRQSNELRRLSYCHFDQNLSRFPTNVIVKIAGRSRLVSLKRIPMEQMIHVDHDGRSFSIPTRQFIVAISQGYAQEAAAKYCPPAISEMLIDLSKTKVADDGKQYKRALVKLRMGKMLFFSLFIFISGMILALVISAAKTVFQLHSFDHTNSNISMTAFATWNGTNEYLRSR